MSPHTSSIWPLVGCAKSTIVRYISTFEWYISRRLTTASKPSKEWQAKPEPLKLRRTCNKMWMQHRLTYRHIQPILKKPQPWMLPATRNEFWGCRHHQAFLKPISMVAEKSHAPCSHSHQFQGCPPISLTSSPPARLSSKPLTTYRQACLCARHQTHQLANQFVQTRTPLEVASRTTLQCCDTNQPNPKHKDLSSSGNSSNYPFFKHTFTTHNSQASHHHHVGQALLWQSWDSNGISVDWFASHTASHDWRMKSINQW